MRCHSRRAPAGAYTLIELLIVVAILAILVGILIPAVHKIREAGNRIACGNNLKQIGQAWHGHHATHGRLPDGGKNACQSPYASSAMEVACANPRYLGHSTPAKGTRTEWSWPYQILPYLEQADLYSLPNTSEDNARITQTPLKAYNCPARRSSRLYGPKAGHATIDYAGCAGTGANGMLVRQGLGPLRFADVTDGLSNTIMVGERRLKCDRFGATTDDNESWADPGWDLEIYRIADDDLDRPTGDRGPSPDIRETDPAVFPDLNSGLRQFGSSHPRGINVILGDGSLRFIRYNPSPGMFLSSCVRNDGSIFDPNGFE